MYSTLLSRAPSLEMVLPRYLKLSMFRSCVSSMVMHGLDKEITSRIQKASQALGRLWVKVLQHKDIRLSTKLKVYNVVVVSSLLYGCETWTLYRRHVKQLEQFHNRALRSIMQIHWQDRISNLTVLDRANSTSIEAKVLKAQLRWTGHVIRMDESRMPRQLFYGELEQGNRARGRPRKRYKDNLKLNLKWAKLQPRDLEHTAADRSKWRNLCSKAANNFQAKSQERHREASAPAPTGGAPCPICNHICALDFGLRSHMRAHRR
ncbi:uncharacterized protein LOC132406918 isoform X1 [Hypanus sabinus]|uniref:uncharacterized protein LOC132406918 isoform X1 n=1 Tax=Hypanus sabinus TaxID=79690 RepID=UPI0028C46B2B|nr:uncharacterized protein LOC132406918 isoform X1 [Hypanus sabinus]